MGIVHFWSYMLVLTLLILHEMDSTYWKEWDLFHLPGGLGGFLLIHFPLWIAALYGLVQVWEGTPAGRVFSIILSLAGMAGFGIHTWFLRTGHTEFDTPVSKGILRAMLLTSAVLFVVAIL